MDIEPSDTEIITRSFDDGSAFAGIFDRHYLDVYRYAARRIGVEPGSDVAAEVFLIAFERRRTFRSSAVTARPWLFGIASNLIRKERTRFAKHLATVDALNAADRPLVQPVQPAWIDLRAALLQLDEDARELLLLIAWDGLSYDEAAEFFGVPIGTVRSRLHRAKHHLCALVDPPLSHSERVKESQP